jgi:ATP-dependent RNA helicase DDX49/DBP8
MSAIFEAKAESVFLMAFEKLGLGKWISKTLLNLGMNEPTEIQNICIPEILSGKNVIGCSKTGSGKTAAFALPILQQLSVDPFGIYALVLAPTRELAFQIAEQFRIMGHPIGLKQSIIVGGMDMMTQSIELDKKPHLIIATPGRLADHLRNTANHGHFKRIKFLVLDEADYLLNDTLTEDLHTILDQMPKKRQTLLFSATITDEIKSIASNGTFIHKTVQE